MSSVARVAFVMLEPDDDRGGRHGARQRRGLAVPLPHAGALHRRHAHAVSRAAKGSEVKGRRATCCDRGCDSRSVDSSASDELRMPRMRPGVGLRSGQVGYRLTSRGFLSSRTPTNCARRELIPLKDPGKRPR
jgi:hypothetical protein